MPAALIVMSLFVSLAGLPPDLESARDRQDKAALEAIAQERSRSAKSQPNDARTHYGLALAQSYLAEVCLELRDKECAKTAAADGIQAAERAVALEGHVAEHHRILGTLCGQIIPAHLLSGLRYGRCAMESIETALKLDPKSSLAYLSRGVGNYYLPSSLGGGVELAIRDFQEAIRLNPKSADAHLWLGLALRRASRNLEARAALEKSIALNPRRVWAKQQLDKTPAK